MNKIFRIIFIVILVILIYHVIRDILQIANVQNNLVNLWHKPHLWCRPYCNYITFPLELSQITGLVVILTRNKVGLLGILIILSLFLWLPVALLP